MEGCPICIYVALGRAFDQAGMADSAIVMLEPYLSTPWSNRFSLQADAINLAAVYGWVSCTRSAATARRRRRMPRSSWSSGKTPTPSSSRRSARHGLSSLGLAIPSGGESGRGPLSGDLRHITRHRLSVLALTHGVTEIWGQS